MRVNQWKDSESLAEEGYRALGQEEVTDIKAAAKNLEDCIQNFRGAITEKISSLRRIDQVDVGHQPARDLGIDYWTNNYIKDQFINCVPCSDDGNDCRLLVSQAAVKIMEDLGYIRNLEQNRIATENRDGASKKRDPLEFRPLIKKER